MIKEIAKFHILFYNNAGFYHRLDGPALEWYDDGKEWNLLGKLLYKEEFNNWILRAKAIYYDKGN